MITIANIFARFSCPMWMPFWPVRYICRKIYRWLAENTYLYRRALRKMGFCNEQLANLSKLRFDVDTYPPLYADLDFAPWDEVADPDNPKRYNLISSRSGCVIRYPTDYCAHKIFELTGQYPRRLDKERHDSKDWVKFLANAGYDTIVDRPHTGHHYVGVIPGEGEFGQVVWFGMIGRAILSGDEEEDLAVMYSDNHSGYLIIPCDDDDLTADYFCSTYSYSEFNLCCIDHGDRRVIWVQID